MLVLERIRYRYAGTRSTSLSDVDVQVQDGEVVGLAGPSESGKTTVCLVASGLAPRAIRGELTGRLLIDGEDVVDLRMEELVVRVGICFQDPATQLSGVCATVYEEVAFGPMNLGIPRGQVIQQTENAIDAMGIGELIERDPAHLSGGQAQLVALAGILAIGPAQFVLDEPTAQLDPQGTDLVAEAIGRLAVSGASILIAEQKTDLLAKVCHRVVVLDQGRVVLEGAAADVLQDPRLPELGVAEPSGIRLARLAREAGLDEAGLGIGT